MNVLLTHEDSTCRDLCSNRRSGVIVHDVTGTTGRLLHLALIGLSTALLGSGSLTAQDRFHPTPGLEGKEVVWIPTPPELVEKMLDMAGVTAQDVVMDLGSGDGRSIIAAARRGARAVGIEYNPDMVALSQRLASEAGVAGKAT